MYTVLLTDDEQAVLDVLTSSIPWTALGVNLVLTATDGCRALEIVNHTHIDLLITDIRMPHMDGLELLQHIRDQHPEIHCILLTAYGEFEYARRALQLGVENYLLKPFQRDEMEKTIEKALDNLYHNQQNTDSLFRNNILSRWANNNISSEELSERAMLLNINVYLNTYCVICIRKRDRICSVSAFTRNFIDQIEPACNYYTFWDDNGRYVIILGASSLSIDTLKKSCYSLAQESPYIDAFFIAIGSIVESSEKVAQSYQTACSLLNVFAYRTDDSFLLTPQEHNSPAHFTDITLSNTLKTIFLETDPSKCEMIYQELTEKIMLKTKDKNAAFSYLSSNLLLLFQQEFPNNTELLQELCNRIQLLATTISHDEASNTMNILLKHSYVMFRYSFEQLTPVVQKAIKYIYNNYDSGLSIKEFCAKQKINPAYFGSLFRKETGIFFNQYLIQYRICKSLQLLRDTNLHINDIAKKTGFSSSSYFISCFQKQIGLSPIKYRTENVNI